MFRNNLSFATINKSPFSETDQNNFPWRRHRAVGGCGQRINAPTVKAKYCWGFGSERGGDHVLEAGGDSLTVRWSRQRNSSSTALDPFHEKPNQRTACCMDGKTNDLCQLSWTEWSWMKFGSRHKEERRGKFRSSFLPQTLYLKKLWDILSWWVQLQDISII